MPSNESPEDLAALVEAKKRALAGFKGHLTRAVNALVKQATFVSKNPPTDAHVVMLEKLHQKMLDQEKKLVQRVEEVADLDLDNAEAYHKDLDGYCASVQDATDLYSLTLVEVHKALAAPVPTVSASPSHGPAGGQRPRSVDALKPNTLSRDATHVIFTSWLARLRAWFDASHFELSGKTEQHHYTYACLDDYLVERIKSKVRATTDVFGGADTIEGLLRAEFDATHPLFVRRHEFFKTKQSIGQRFSDWANSLRAQGDECQLAELTPDSVYSLRYVVGCIDNDLLQKLLETDGELASMNRAVAEYEVRKVTTVSTSTKVSGIGLNQSSRGSSSSAGCPGCGDSSCNDRKTCRAKDSTCNWCLRKGHWAAVCKGKAAGKPRAKAQSRAPWKSKPSEAADRAASNASSKACRASACSDGLNEPTPRLDIVIKNRVFSALPDTGATRTVVPLKLAQEMLLDVDKAVTANVTTANNQHMECVGSAVVEISTVQPTVTTVTNALVCSDASDIFIGWKDLISLRRLPRDFPCVVASAASQRAASINLEPIISEFPDVFDDVKVKPMAGPAMHIHLKQDVTPKAVYRPRQIPHHLQEEAQKVLDMTIASGVIVPVSEPTDWISPAFFVPKPDGRARLVTDYTQLNKFVARPVHPFPSPQEIVRSIDSSSKFFAKLDAASGYFQIPLDEESSLLTTFLLPSGKYRYTRAPMGLSSSSDEFCRRSDEAIKGIKGVLKIVDDILVQGSTEEELLSRITQVLKRCQEKGITLYRSKAEAGSSVKFAGYIISSDGVKPDPSKVQAITDFPRPSDVTGVRSFLGLANQLGMFVSNLAMVTNPLRQLLKKDSAFSWTAEHEVSFNKCKDLLNSSLCVVPFTSDRPTCLYTDASCLNGLGFVLMQEGRVIQAGSRSLIDAETRYAVIELEATAIAWAVNNCRHYLIGCPTFTVYTDHRPLVGIFEKDMTDIDNPRLVRLREKLLGYNFNVEWINGKANAAADALSRSPIASVIVAAAAAESTSVVEELDDPALDELVEATKVDQSIIAVKQALARATPYTQLPKQHVARSYKHVYNTLSLHSTGLLLVDGHRIVVPAACRRQILEGLHKPHAGITRTRKWAKEAYYWPGMVEDIAKVVENCEECQQVRQANPVEEPFVERPAFKPMEAVSVDLFEFRGKHYVVMVDRYSSMPFISKLTTLGTHSVIRILTGWFNEVGWPKSLGSDGGPQFREEFTAWAKSNKIKFELSSSYNPMSNGLAESGVKRMKHLLEKSDSWTSFLEALLAFKNVPTARGESPASLFYGRKLRIPEIPIVEASSKSDPTPPAQDVPTSPSRRFSIGDQVRIYNRVTKRWDTTGIITDSRNCGRSFFVEKRNGRETLRNRRFLRRIKTSA
jgi:DNA-binding protein Fis